MTHFYIIFLGIVLLACSGCSSGNRAIPLDMPAEALENAVQQVNGDPLFHNGDPIPQEWWLLFNDSQLSTFIQTTFARNPTLQSAKTQILAAAYNADRVRSSLYPYLSLGADVSRQKLSKTGVIPFDSGPPGSGTPITSVPVMPGAPSPIPVYFTLYETEFNLNYHFDFWDKNRNTLRAALGQVQATVAEEVFARLQIGIAVAEVYYQLQIDYQREEIATLIVDNRLRYVDLVQKRLNAHIDNQSTLQTAVYNLSAARDFLLQIQGDIAVKQYQLGAYMSGNFDEQIVGTDVVKQSLPKISLPEDLPLHLIAQRPDISAQLWVIESAGYQIEAAKAGFYPDFNLMAFFGFQTIHFADLFKWPSRYFNVDPALSLPIFDGGLLLANLRGSEIHYDTAILDYNNLVINAAKEVLSAIAVLQNSSQRRNQFEQQYAHQSELYRLTHLKVSHHLSNRLDELLSEEAMLTAQDQAVLAQGNTIQAILELIKALGGGYDGYNNCEGQT